MKTPLIFVLLDILFFFAGSVVWLLISFRRLITPQPRGLQSATTKPDFPPDGIK